MNFYNNNNNNNNNNKHKKNCSEEDAAGKKLFAHTTTQKKIVCLEKIFIPSPLQKNNGPSLKLLSSYKCYPGQLAI